jgi:CRP-like cAMP-binding protein
VITAQQIRLVRSHPIWREASDPSVRSLIAASRDVRVMPGDKILTAGEPAKAIHLLVEGAARVYYPASGEQSEITVKLFWAPASFGDAESILRTSWAECVEALTPGRVLITPAETYFRLMQSEPSVCFRQYWDVARRFGIAIRTERQANLGEMTDRTIAILLAYAHHFGKDTGDGVLIDFPLTQEEIGKQVGANRRTIVTVLSGLYDKGVVVRSGRRLIVPSLEKLLAEAGAAAPALSFRTDDRPWAERR